MKEFVPKNENVSRTLEYQSSASRQKSIVDMLQAYANEPLGSRAIPNEKPEDKEIPAQEINKPRSKVLEKEAGATKAEAPPFAPLAYNLPAAGLHPGAIQRMPLTSTVNGLTHLVRINGRSIYRGEEERELTDGTRITVETSHRIRSRRGPNQEIFREQDVWNDHIYRWVKVLEVENEVVSEDGLYIRDDTFEGGTDIPSSRDSLLLCVDESTRSRLEEIEYGKKPRQSTEPRDEKNDTVGEEEPWYPRSLNSRKKSTADLKHAKLLAAAFDCEIDEIGTEMRRHAADPDMIPVLETIEQHMRHVAPWIPGYPQEGKDRHPGYEQEGEYFRTSVGHPSHQAYEEYQRILGLYEENVTTQPVNPGWAENARLIMGIGNMDNSQPDDLSEEIPVWRTEHPDRIARGPGAVIGNEAMARHTARLRAAALRAPFSLEDIERQIDMKDRKIGKLYGQKAELEKARAALGRQKAALEEEKAALKSQQNSLSEDRRERGLRIRELANEEKEILEQIKQLNKGLTPLPKRIKKAENKMESLRHCWDFCREYPETPPLHRETPPLPRATDLRPLATLRPVPRRRPADRPFAERLLRNRRNVHLSHLFPGAEEGMGVGVTDKGGDAHPNLILEKGAWRGKEDEGVQELHHRWETSRLATSLQVRGSFGHHRPSVSPLADGRVRINPGLYPMSLLRIGVGTALRVNPFAFPPIDPREDFMHREALDVAVQHALQIITAVFASAPGMHPSASSTSSTSAPPTKMERIKEFAKNRLIINLRKAQIILSTPISSDPDNPDIYLRWLENDFVKTALVLENLNESTHLLLTAIVREATGEAPTKADAETRLAPLLQPGAFLAYVTHLFAEEERNVAVYYVESGMQALTTAAMAAVDFRRRMETGTLPGEEADGSSSSSSPVPPGRKAGFIPLHPYFEMKDQTAAAAGFHATLSPETIIADLSPVDTKATPEEQSQEAVREGLARAFEEAPGLVPVLDATATPLDEAKAMVPPGCPNFIIVESLTKYAQLGSDKALGGRIIVVGDPAFIAITHPVISRVEAAADMLVSRIWFETMENGRYSR